MQFPPGLLQRLGFILYWLAFAILTIRQAKHPGLVLHGDLPPFPWRGIAATWIVLAIETLILYVVLRPLSFQAPWKRVGKGFLYATGLVVFTVFTTVTDMPGYYYVPGIFAVVTFLCITLFSAIKVLFSLGAWQKKAL